MANEKKKAGKGEKKKKRKKKKNKERDAAPPLRMRLLEQVTLDVRSASAIAPLGRGFALVVDDDEGIFLVGGAGGAELLRGREHAKGLGDLESVCVSDDGRTVYAVSEEKGQVFSFAVAREGDGFVLSDATLLGRLGRPGDAKNKGWEGASYRAASSDSSGSPCLVVSHEREPAAIGVFTLPDLRELAMIELEGALADLLDDVADVAVCATTGHLFLLSDQSHRVVEARLHLERGELELVGGFDLELDDGEKPEGIAFESPDRLVIVTDASSRLLRFSVERRLAGRTTLRAETTMIHNDVLRSVRFMLNVGDHTIADIIQLGGLEVPLGEVAGYLTKEDERGHRECPDLVMAHFLDGLIVHRRGKNEKLADRPVDPAITNNVVLKKLRVAFELKEDDILSMMAAAQQPVSKPELSALFRSPGHKNYRPCGDQFLRKFLKSLTQRVRG